MKLASVICLGACLVLAVPFRSAHSQPQTKTLGAGQILQHMVKAYAECKSYSDSGIVTQYVHVRGKIMDAEVNFKTAFIRPKSFRFEFVAKSPWYSDRFIIWRSGDQTSTWSSLDAKMVKEQSLAMGIAKATGISGLSSLTIPALLLPVEVGKGARTINNLKGIKRLKNEQVGGGDCFCLAGQWASQPTKLWIDAKSFAVRKIEIKGKLNQDTVYSPSVNQAVPAEALKFNVPKTG